MNMFRESAIQDQEPELRMDKDLVMRDRERIPGQGLSWNLCLEVWMPTVLGTEWGGQLCLEQNDDDCDQFRKGKWDPEHQVNEWGRYVEGTGESLEVLEQTNATIKVAFYLLFINLAHCIQSPFKETTGKLNCSDPRKASSIPSWLNFLSS